MLDRIQKLVGIAVGVFTLVGTSGYLLIDHIQNRSQSKFTIVTSWIGRQMSTSIPASWLLATVVPIGLIAWLLRRRQLAPVAAAPAIETGFTITGVHLGSWDSQADFGPIAPGMRIPSGRFTIKGAFASRPPQSERMALITTRQNQMWIQPSSRLVIDPAGSTWTGFLEENNASASDVPTTVHVARLDIQGIYWQTLHERFTRLPGEHKAYPAIDIPDGFPATLPVDSRATLRVAPKPPATTAQQTPTGA